LNSLKPFEIKKKTIK